MYSSPATPRGTGASRASSTYTCVLAIGRPIETGPPSAASRLHGATRWSSRWGRRGSTARRTGPAASARSRGRASPPQSTFSVGAPRQPMSSSSRQVAGVACMHGGRRSTRAAPTAAAPSMATSRLASTTRPPADQRQVAAPGPAMSNESVVTASSMSSPGQAGGRASTRGSWPAPVGDLRRPWAAGRAGGVDDVGEVARPATLGGGCASPARAIGAQSRSRQTGCRCPRVGSGVERRRSVSEHAHRASSSMKASRAAGNAGSSGT